MKNRIKSFRFVSNIILVTIFIVTYALIEWCNSTLSIKDKNACGDISIFGGGIFFIAFVLIISAGFLYSYIGNKDK